MNQFAKAREQVGIGPAEAARRLGINYQTLWAYERGKSMPKMEMIRKMAVLYKVDPNYLFGWPKNPKSKAA